MLHIHKLSQNRRDSMRPQHRLHISNNRHVRANTDHHANGKHWKLARSLTFHTDHPRNEDVYVLTRVPSLQIKPTIEHQRQTRVVREDRDTILPSNKISTRSDEKFHNQTANNTNRLGKSTRKEHQWSISISSPSPSSFEHYRSSTASFIFEDNFRPLMSARVKSVTPSHTPTPIRTSFSNESPDNYLNVSYSITQYKPIIFKRDDQQVFPPNNHENFLHSSVNTSTSEENPIQNSNETKRNRRSSQHKINPFEHIMNLGSWQRKSKTRQKETLDACPDIDCDEEYPLNDDTNPLNLSKPMYEYKSPFTEECEQAISSQAQLNANNNVNDWNLREFYRDCKTTNFDADGNMKQIFEKCMRLARLQAITIKWEQRHRQNLHIYNRFLKTSTIDNCAINIPVPYVSKNGNDRDIRDINDLRRELRCNECKRLGCLGNCAPGQDYRQYKRFVPPAATNQTSRDSIRSKLSSRSQRQANDVRPRSTQQVTRDTKSKHDIANFNPPIVTPSLDDDTQIKRSHKKFSSTYLSGTRPFRSQRKETLTLLSTNKIS